jgi:peptidoglycan/LPS O-acetylase OafA/YrhL
LSAVAGAAGAALAIAIASAGRNTLGSAGDNFAMGLIRVLFSYGCGLILARLWLAGRLPPWLRWRWSYAVLAPLALVATLPFWPISRAAGDIAVTLVLLPLCFAFTVQSDLPKHLTPLFAGLGLLSYPLYAVHMPILTIAWLVLPQPWRALGPIAALSVAAVVARVLEGRRTKGLQQVRGVDVRHSAVEA